jgi:hypothetical protein
VVGKFICIGGEVVVECDGIVRLSRWGGRRGTPSGSDVSCVDRDGVVGEIVDSFEGGEVKNGWPNFVV